MRSKSEEYRLRFDDITNASQVMERVADGDPKINLPPYLVRAFSHSASICLWEFWRF